MSLIRERASVLFMNIDYHSANLKGGWYIKLRIHSSSPPLTLNLYIVSYILFYYNVHFCSIRIMIHTSRYNFEHLSRAN